MARTSNTARKPKPAKTETKSRVSKLLKSKLRLKSKSSKAQIDKLNSGDILDVHSEMKQQSAKENVLDAGKLREDLKKDEETTTQNKKAENDLTAQLQLITGMAL